VRCLKRGSPLAVCVPDGSVGDSALRYQVPDGKHIDGQHVHLFTESTLAAYLQVAGLENVKVSTYDREPYWTTKIIMGTGIKGSAFQESPYRWRTWSWAKEVLRDLPIIPRVKAEYRDWKISSARRALFGR
jgi:hypothetical protein